MRTMTLRGSYYREGPGIEEELLFTNASPDKTRAWKVKDSQIWLVKGNNLSYSPLFKYGGFFNIQQQLQTDTIPTTVSDLNPEDNRTFGWIRNLITVSKGSGSITAATSNEMKCIDPDHIITDQLYHSIGYMGDNQAESTKVTIGYMITLEQIKISPIESILQTIKGRSQDVGV